MEVKTLDDLGPEVPIQYDGFIAGNLPVAAFFGLIALAFVGWETKVRGFPSEWIGYGLLTLLLTMFLLLGAYFFEQWYVLNLETRTLEWRQRFANFEWKRAVADLDEISHVMLNPKYVMARADWYWEYPLCLVTHRGKTICICNLPETRERESYSLPLARGVAELIGISLVEGEPEQAVTVRLRQGRVCFEPIEHNPDTGLTGKLLIFLAISALIWGLWKLTQF
ncbi:MAG: hypothetical protein WC314_03675 [Vulcanimicrobiota bacterium]